MVRLPVVVALAASLLVAGASAVCSQEARQNEAGSSTFYVLSLSWSPSFVRPRPPSGAAGAAPTMQCGARPYSFVVHGLWPQYDKGFPEYCQVPSPRLVSRHRFFDARSDAGAASDLQRMGQARYLLGPVAARLFRHRAQSPRGGEDPARICRSARAAQRHAGRGRRMPSSKPIPALPQNGIAIELRQEAADRGQDLPCPRICNSATAPMSRGAAAGVSNW